MIIRRFVKKRWEATLWRGNGLLVIAVPYIGNRTLFDECLIKNFSNSDKIAFSQFADENQWSRGNKFEYVRSIKVQHTVDLIITKTLSDPEMPEKDQAIFAYHGIAPLRLELIKDVLHYGMTSIPNIIYEYKDSTSDWLSKLTNWNALFLEWYRFRASENSIANIINQTGLIAWTSDYHLSFGITNIQQLSTVIDGLEKVSTKQNLSLQIESRKLPYG